MQDIGHRIRICRVRSNLSQEALAEILGVTRQAVSKWERGQSLPEIVNIIMLSRLFNVTTDALLIGEHHTK
ncbi:MAG: helix-turn-helix domain-containing protein [Oscillospiraceae bacterium]|nr:helix-turn-helix domain-containing protein [Oscillospiraceae bacterium]